MDAPADIRPMLAHVVPYVLVMFRMAGVFLMAPVLTSVMIPMRAKALLTMMLTAAAYPLLADSLRTPAGLDLFGLVPLVVSEALIGLAIGAIAAIPLLSLETAGVIMGQSMGFSLARVYSPESSTDTDLLGQLLFYIGAGVFVALGGLDQLLAGVLDTFRRVPLGGFGAEQMPMDLFVGVLTSGTELALRVALPVSGITLLLIIVLGVITKTMPQINIMSVGFTIKIVAGLLMLALALWTIGGATGAEVQRALADALRWARSL